MAYYVEYVCRTSTIENELQDVYKASTYNEQVVEMHEAWKVRITRCQPALVSGPLLLVVVAAAAAVCGDVGVWDGMGWCGCG